MKFLSKKQNGIFITVILMAIISTMMATALSSALPAIMTDFKISAGSAQWVTSLYSLVSGIMILITAFIIKRFPTRKIFLISVGSFTLGSLISALASNFIILIIGRIFQGIGNGLVLALTQVIILKIFPADRQGFGMGLYGLAIGLTPVIAPLIAGILIDVGSWRLIFYVVIVICIVDLILAFIFLDNILDQEKSSFDISSMIYAALAFTGIIYGLGNIGNFKFFNLQTGGSLLVGLIFLFIFYTKQLHMKAPLLNVKAFESKEFAFSTLISFLLYAILNGTTTVLPIYIQTLQGKSATVYGLVMMPAALLIGILSPIAGNIYDKYGIRILGLVGSISLIIFTIMATSLNLKSSILFIIIATIFEGIGVAALMTPIMTWGLKYLPENLITDGTAIINCLRTIGGALGAALFAAIVTLFSTSVGIIGIRMSFMVMGAVSLLMLLIALLFIKEKTNY